MSKFLIAGLGNIGAEYAHTRHNIGFDIVNGFVTRHGGSFSSDRLAFRCEIRWKGKILVCICPTTYMNLSGKAVKYWLDKEKLGPDQALVIYDELALPLSRIRIRGDGSDGGHNGLKSIQASLGTTQYPRLRFGIGNDYSKGRQVDFVLGKWTDAESVIVGRKIDLCAGAIESFATTGLDFTMNKYNNVEITL